MKASTKKRWKLISGYHHWTVANKRNIQSYIFLEIRYHSSAHFKYQHSVLRSSKSRVIISMQLPAPCPRKTNSFGTVNQQKIKQTNLSSHLPDECIWNTHQGYDEFARWSSGKAISRRKKFEFDMLYLVPFHCTSTATAGRRKKNNMKVDSLISNKNAIYQLWSVILVKWESNKKRKILKASFEIE